MRRSTAPLEAVVLPDLPPPRGNRWGVVAVGAAFIAILVAVVAAIWAIGKLAGIGEPAAAGGRQSLVEHWEAPEERLKNIAAAMNSSQVGATPAELRDFQRFFARVASASRKDDQAAYLECVDLNLLVHRISRHPAVRGERSFSSWGLKNELQTGLSTLGYVGDYSIVRVERGERDDLALVYTVDCSPLATACRWWLARSGRNWRLFDWERLDYEQSTAHRWAIRDKLYSDSNSYNYNIFRNALDDSDQLPAGVNWPIYRDEQLNLASLIDNPLPEVVHDGAMLELAWALVGLGRPAAAIRAADALRRPQDHPGYLVVRARAKADLGRYAEALADAQAYQQLAGRDPLALEQAARALAELDRPAEAAECWLEMLKLAPNHHMALGNFCRLADSEQRAQLPAILHQTRQTTEAVVSQAQASLYRDDLESFELLAAFVKAEAPGSPAAAALAGQRLDHEGQHEEAAAKFREAADAEFRPDQKQGYFHQSLTAMAAAGKIAQAYAAAPDPQAAFDYLTAGFEDDESLLTDEQLKALLAAHEQRVPGDARALYLAGQLLLRGEKYAEADAKFQAAVAKADEESRSTYEYGRIEALYRQGDVKVAYRTCGQTREVFRALAGHCESDRAWDELETLIKLHRKQQDDDRWADYYEAKLFQAQGNAALALASLLQAEKDDDLKGYSSWTKTQLYVEAGRMQECITPQNRRQDFLNIANLLAQKADWQRLDDLYRNNAAVIGRDPMVLNAWTSRLWQQGRYDDIVSALESGIATDSSAPAHVERELVERQVRCLLRLGRAAEARQVAHRASNDNGLEIPLVMVLLHEGNMAAVREKLADPAIRKSLQELNIEEDPELSPLVASPELADLRQSLILPLNNFGIAGERRVILLLAEPRELVLDEIADLLARSSIEGAKLAAAAHDEGAVRRSARIEHQGTSLVVTFGNQPYWKRGRFQRPPREAELARILESHRGFIVLESDRRQHDAPGGDDLVLLGKLAGGLCNENVQAVHVKRSAADEGRLLALEPSIVEQFKSGQLLSGPSPSGQLPSGQAAGITFPLYDAASYSDEPAAAERLATSAKVRTANQLARDVNSGKVSDASIQVELWRGHGRERVWLKVVGAKRDASGGWQLHGEMPADSALRPGLRAGMRLSVGPYDVQEVRRPTDES
ncbi:MAG: hypothetical protein L0211_06755 [Planctomycetaceae bacterium]|nr:hypothetical protein [Planctomycetaceae bacterium]